MSLPSALGLSASLKHPRSCGKAVEEEVWSSRHVGALSWWAWDSGGSIRDDSVQWKTPTWGQSPMKSGSVPPFLRLIPILAFVLSLSSRST